MVETNLPKNRIGVAADNTSPALKHPSARLTKYERTQVIGLRSEQLARGAQAFVEVDPAGRETVFEIAERELYARRLPLIVVRNLPDGKTEHLRLSH